MNLDLPSDLEPTRQMLETSLRLRASERAPAVPEGLLDELNRRLGAQRIVIEPKRRSPWAARLRQLVASPGFGLASAALLVFGVLTPLLDFGDEPWRGIPVEVVDPAMILLVGGPPELANNLAQSGQFESGRMMSLNDLTATEEIAGPKVILDFENATIFGINENEEIIHTGTLPSSIADLIYAVGVALDFVEAPDSR